MSGGDKGSPDSVLKERGELFGIYSHDADVSLYRILIPYYKVLELYGLKDSLVGMMCVYILILQFHSCSWMMVGFFRTIQLELDEAAINIDGCSRWKAFYKITLPMTFARKIILCNLCIHHGME